MTWTERVRAMRMDVTPLRDSRDFRLLFTAGSVFYLGSMVAYVAVPFAIYDLTGSNFMVGLVGLVELLPLVVFGLYGGALADLNVMHLGTPQSAIISAIVFNALVIPALVPLALRGVRYRPLPAARLLRDNLLVYGLGGLVVPFLGIKAIDLALAAIGVR